MKRILKIWLSILVGAASLHGEEPQQSVEGDMGHVVQIRVISQLHYQGQKWNNAYLYPIDEFYYFSKALEKSLESIEGNYHFVIVRFPGKLDDSQFGITLYLDKWGISRSGQIDARFRARYVVGDEKGQLGSFSGRSFQSISTIRKLREREYERAVLEAGEQMVEKLQPILDSYFAREEDV